MRSHANSSSQAPRGVPARSPPTAPPPPQRGAESRLHTPTEWCVPSDQCCHGDCAAKAGTKTTTEWLGLTSQCRSHWHGLILLHHLW